MMTLPVPVSPPDFRAEIDALLERRLTRFYQTVKGADHLLTSDAIDPEYYKRHVIEIILRLRLKRVIDALTVHYFTKTDPVLAKKWAGYTEDEMLHDSLFATDLERIGVSKEEIYSTDPLLSTKLLQGYFYYGLEHEGRPLASLCSAYLIESLANKTQPKWISNIERNFGDGAAKGQFAHASNDIADEHIDFVWSVLSTFANTEADRRRIRDHFVNIAVLFEAFYTEMATKFLDRQENHEPIVDTIAAN